MPRSGYSRDDPIATRSGYVSYNDEPVDHRGGTESHSGRINHRRMDAHASPDTFLPSLDYQSRCLHAPKDRLYSSNAVDLSGIRSRDDLPRNEPSEEYERRTRGYNPGYFGERKASFGSSPQLGGLDLGYRGEKSPWPKGSPIQRDWNDYKRDEERGDEQIKEYDRSGKEWERSRQSTAYRPPHLRDEDAFDRRQSKTAAEASKCYQSAKEKRTDHNLDYIGHWPRAQRKGHKEAVTYCEERSVEYRNMSQRHLDSKNGRWRDKWQSAMDRGYPKEDDDD